MAKKELTYLEQRRFEGERLEERCNKIVSELLQILRDHEVSAFEFSLINERLNVLVNRHLKLM